MFLRSEKLYLDVKQRMSVSPVKNECLSSQKYQQQQQLKLVLVKKNSRIGSYDGQNGVADAAADLQNRELAVAAASA